MKKYLIFLLILVFPMVYVLSCNSTNKPIGNSISFEKKLSKYRLFKSMENLQPDAGIEVIELSSTLFTDYADKQRLLKLPKGGKIKAKDSGLPIFPEGTILAKTFYYTLAKSKARKIIETRLLILKNANWNAATYRWNTQQNEANFIEDGAEIPIDILHHGESMPINYQIPSQRDCSSCHRSNSEILPLGPKLRNLNRRVERNGQVLNQLAYWRDRGLLEIDDLSKIDSLPNYADPNLTIEKRARAYLELNCAHCHSPNGFAGNTSLNLSYETNYNRTGIPFNKSNIVVRMDQMGEYHMPKIGTTVIDQNGVQLIKKYLISIKK